MLNINRSNIDAIKSIGGLFKFLQFICRFSSMDSGFVVFLNDLKTFRCIFSLFQCNFSLFDAFSVIFSAFLVFSMLFVSFLSFSVNFKTFQRTLGSLQFQAVFSSKISFFFPRLFLCYLSDCNSVELILACLNMQKNDRFQNSKRQNSSIWKSFEDDLRK